MRPFRISEQDLDPGARELRVEGELDIAVAGQLKSRLDAAAAEDVDVFVRLDECDFIDCTGLAAIVSAGKLMASKGRRLRLCNASAQVARLLDLTGLNDDGLACDPQETRLVRVSWPDSTSRRRRRSHAGCEAAHVPSLRRPRQGRS